MGRHRLPSTHKQYQIEQMWEIHHEICRLALIGMKSIDIATHLNISPVTVSYVLRSPIVQRQIGQLEAVRDIDAIDASVEIKKLVPAAIKKMDDLMDCGLPNVEIKAAADILDRAGYAAVKTLRTENIHAHFSADEISDIKKRAREVGLLTDNIYEDAEIIEVGKSMSA